MVIDYSGCMKGKKNRGMAERRRKHNGSSPFLLLLFLIMMANDDDDRNSHTRIYIARDKLMFSFSYLLLENLGDSIDAW
jgi:hypothetical protein